MKLPTFLESLVKTEGDNYSIQLNTKVAERIVIILAIFLILLIGFGVWGIARQAEVMQLRQQTQLQTEQLKLLNQKTQILEKKIQTLDVLDQEIREMIKGAATGTPKSSDGNAISNSDGANGQKQDPATYTGQGGPENSNVATVGSTTNLENQGATAKALLASAEKKNESNTSSSSDNNASNSDKADTNSNIKVEETATLTPVKMSAKLSKLDVAAQRRLASFYTLRNILKDGVSDDINKLNSTIFAMGNPNAMNSTVPSIWPTQGVITSPFGSRIDPVYGSGAYHEGLDIAADYGTPIIATAAGVVTFAGYTDGGYGNLVIIDHGNGFETRYGHNAAVLVTVGAHVNQGQAIALMGSTGKSTGSHTHYEVRIGGSPVDPMLFLPITP